MSLRKPLALLAAGMILVAAATLGVRALRPLALAFPLAVSTAGGDPYPWGVAVNLATNRIYVANRRSASVSVIDGAANRVIATIPITSAPATEGRTRLPTRGRAISRHLAAQAGFPARGAAGVESTVGASVAMGRRKLGW